jgi:hypothetical protein
VNERELKFWLENMVTYHGFTVEEIQAATGLSPELIQSKIRQFKLKKNVWPKIKNETLKVLPYPGGRHPRIGFLEGAINPQRESKFSLFTPWDHTSYVVVDVPEAIWCQKGLLYLAHTHVPTLWTKQGVQLPKLEWRRGTRGVLTIDRLLPDGVVFGATVRPERDAVRMELWLKNGSKERLSDLRVQNCVMLKGASGFARQTSANKILQPPFVATRDDAGRRWIITAWVPSNRTWANPPVPCMHADPKFPDCAPGETKRLHGWISFYKGEDLQGELRRLAKIDWLADPIR